MSSLAALLVGEQGVSIQDVVDVARGRRSVSVDGALRSRVAESRAFVEDWLQSGQVAYGINTGFGSLAHKRISAHAIETLQQNLVRSHSAGVGEPLAEEVVRAMMLLRAVALLQGYSGVRMDVIDLLLDMLDKHVHPVVPCQGSVGASGDLAPLAHLALSMIGEGEVTYKGRRMPAAEAMTEVGLTPLRLQAKEGLALINGTQAMMALGCLAVHDLGVALKTADIVASMSLEALLATDATLHPRLHEARRQPGQMDSAANMRRIVQSSPLIASHKDCDTVQDPYSLRCIAQVHGAAREVQRFAAAVLQREIQAATDNPLVFADAGLILSGGNFHGAPVAMALDCVALAPVYLCNIAERRIYRLTEARQGLPPFLVPDTVEVGLHSGLMLAQYVAAALTSENKVLAHPSSADTIPTSAGQEDHVSMGMWSARKLRTLVEHVFQVLGIEALCAAQALDFRNPPNFGEGTRAAYEALRRDLPRVVEDRVLSGDLLAAAAFVREGRLVHAVEDVTGPLIA